MKKHLNEKINTLLGTGLLASAALFAIITIVDVSSAAEEEFINMMADNRIAAAEAGGFTVEEFENSGGRH